jgi:S-adenosylmethionine:tRNA ribosyltransferase-isomerase
VEPRDASRLLVLDRATGSITHRHFRELPQLVAPHDILVTNTTRVIRARLIGKRDSGAPAEVFLLRQLDDYRFEAMVSPGGKLHPGRIVHVAPELDVEIETITDRRTRIVRLITTLSAPAALSRFGHVPLPPYIERADEEPDAERYQTVYARQEGSVAAPTAGLHFTPELIRALPTTEIVLHVGAGTFKPVETEDPGAHVMHEERYEISAEAAEAVRRTKASGGAVWAVGTTSARALESSGGVAGAGETRLFIRPPYEWRVVDRLITNFHLPRSTLLMLVAAFAGYELTMHAYDVAIREGYRFYSYGDAMAIV